MPEAWPGGPDPAQVAAWEWEKLSPAEKERRLRAQQAADAAHHARRVAERAREQRVRDVIESLAAAGCPGQERRRHAVTREVGRLRKRWVTETVVLAGVAAAWPVGDVLWEQPERRMKPRYEMLPTGVTAEAEIVPMTRARREELDRLAARDQAFRHVDPVIRPQRNELAGEMQLFEGGLLEALTAIAARFGVALPEKP